MLEGDRMGAAAGYYVPHEAKWSIVGSIGLFLFFIGMANWVNGHGMLMLYAGAAIIILSLIHI